MAGLADAYQAYMGNMLQQNVAANPFYFTGQAINQTAIPELDNPWANAAAQFIKGIVGGGLQSYGYNQGMQAVGQQLAPVRQKMIMPGGLEELGANPSTAPFFQAPLLEYQLQKQQAADQQLASIQTALLTKMIDNPRQGAKAAELLAPAIEGGTLDFGKLSQALSSQQAKPAGIETDATGVGTFGGGFGDLAPGLNSTAGLISRRDALLDAGFTDEEAFKLAQGEAEQGQKVTADLIKSAQEEAKVAATDKRLAEDLIKYGPEAGNLGAGSSFTDAGLYLGDLLGFDKAEDQRKARQIVTTAQNKLGLQNRDLIPGPVSEFEAKMLLGMGSAGMLSGEDAAKAGVLLKSQAENKELRAQFLQKYAPALGSQADAVFSQWAEENPAVLGENEKGQLVLNPNREDPDTWLLKKKAGGSSAPAAPVAASAPAVAAPQPAAPQEDNRGILEKLTSADWWLTRPDGERISAGQAVAGPAMTALNALTFNMGDEIVAAGSSAINSDQTYDQALEAARGVRKDFSEASPVADLGLSLAGGAKVLVPSIGKAAAAAKGGGALSKAVQAAKQGAKVGAGYGAAYGFGEGEGGVAQRLEEAKEGALSGALVGGGATLAGKGLQAAAKGAKNLATGFERGAIGVTARDVKAARRATEAGEALGEIELGDTYIDKTIDDLREQGWFKGNMSPAGWAEKARTELKGLTTELRGVVREADKVKGGAQAVPSFKNAEKYVEMQAADEAPRFRAALEKKKAAVLEATDGSIERVHEQKVRFYEKSYDTDEAKSLKALDRAIARDLRETVEKSVDALANQGKLEKALAGSVKLLNAEEAKRLTLLPIFQRAKEFEGAANPLKSAIQALRTSGGFLTTPSVIGAANGIPFIGPLASAAMAGLRTRGGQFLTADALNAASGPLSKVGQSLQRRGTTKSLMSAL